MTVRQRCGVFAGTVVLGLSAAACTSSSNPAADASAATQQFLNAFASGDVAGAAGKTDNAAVAQPALAAVQKAMAPAKVTVSPLGQANVSGSSATVGYTLTWKFNDKVSWADPASAKLSQDNNGAWHVVWASSLLGQDLGPGQSLKLVSDPPVLPSVIGSDGAPLLAPTAIVNVTLYPAQAKDVNAVAGTLAAALGPLDNTITAQSIVTGSATAGAGGYLVARLRQSDYQTVRAQIHDLPGVYFPTGQGLLAPTKSFGAAILPAFRAMAQQEAADYAAMTVSAVDANGKSVRQLFTRPAGTPPNITTTLSGKVQQAAETALATVPQQALSVVVQPSTGHILAIAANPAAVTAGDSPLTGLYPPGSTFKIVTAAAALQSGTVNPTTAQACPGTTTIEGRVIPNENKFDLGTVPLTQAFAQSCNTTFAQLAAGLPANSLPDAARQFGIGASYKIPHFPTNTGSVAADSDQLARAEDGFGQGKDQVSPFGMALAAATVANGTTPTPSLIPDQPTTAAAQPTPLPAQTRTDLQGLMRAVVTTGTAKAIAGVNPPVYGKTGTAQFGDGTQSHGWFVGYQGDLAFAFLLVAAGSSTPAVVVAGNFLHGLAG